jgi:xanthine dehydrogenase accessory factor
MSRDPSLPEPPMPASNARDEDQAALRFAAGRDAALCTIVGIDGSFSRRLGAQWAVAADGSSDGSLSDHCLEQELAARAVDACATGQPLLLRYGRGSPYIDFRLPCGSGIDVLVDPLPDRAAIAAVIERLNRREKASLALPEIAGACQNRAYTPSPRLIILGNGIEARELAHMAQAFGLDHELHGPDQGLGLGRPPDAPSADAWTAIVLLFHDHEWEEALLTWALKSPAFYIGAQGGQQARESRLADLRSSGLSEGQLRRIKSPIGLVKHARDARTLALSVLAEVIADYEALRP